MRIISTISISVFCAFLSSCVTCENLKEVGLGAKTIASFDDPHPCEPFHYMANDSSKFSEYRTIGGKQVDHWKYVREASKKYFVYALMSSNAYGDGEDPQFRIPRWHRDKRYGSCSGLDFDTYYRPSKENPKEVVIAFRGSQGGKDWLAANLSLIPSRQTKESLQFVRNLRAQYSDKVKITATGHSLGGGLALMMSLKVNGVDAIAFDATPRVTAGISNRYPQNKRVYLRETPEFLSFISLWYLKLAIPNLEKRKYNFMAYKPWKAFVPYSEHNMYRLARGLLICATAQVTEKDAGGRSLEKQSRYAREVFEVNMGRSSLKVAANDE